EVGQEGVAALHGAADASDPLDPGLAPPGRLHREPGALRSFLGRLVAVRPVRPRVRQVAPVRLLGLTSASGGCTTMASSTSWVCTPSWAPALVMVAPRGMPYSSVAKWMAVPHLLRSTGEGPVSSPPLLTASSSRRAGPCPS